MEMREIEIFLTAAEELHFTRAAERLGISPARVSQSIKKQERHIGAPLFDRTTRAVRLSPLGEQLYRALKDGHRQITQGITTAQATADGTAGTLTLGTLGPNSVAIKNVADLFLARHPNARVLHREIQPASPLDLLKSGEVDVAHLWLPIREPDLTVRPTPHSSAVLLMVSTDHPYAHRDAIGLEDLGDCAVVEGQSIPAYMEEVFNPWHTPSGRPVRRGPKVTTWQEALSAVASGQATAGVTAEVADLYPWPSLAFVPIRDAAPCRWAFAWRTSAETPLIRAFAQAAADAR
ncbi:LysR family transcriptional regulator [Actinocorallia sp. A-T 12471]|uniref:LysR family transcriptional regulator n=1 Tax=Actinocorallia sp. A-T 12471 TaxID=3089813 RepID=UPI0029CC125D|nr:LysR family transcriptional regulator [Actinocorallia sp. A-T 12471]MDX6743942.1 LysR family transcriptional regulator [Actinocorallia sp. A-T 12471]